MVKHYKIFVRQGMGKPVLFSFFQNPTYFSNISAFPFINYGIDLREAYE